MEKVDTMADATQMLERTAHFTAFATLGAITTTQDIARIALGSLEGADPELVVEETLCLVATSTARAAEVGLRNLPAISPSVVASLVELPFIYRDYLIGGAMIAQKDTSLLEASETVYQRLQRKRAFYTTHLPSQQFPGERALTDKMGLWMGRISPPGLPESPTQRLAKLDLVPTLLTHARLVLAFARKQAG